MTKILINLSDLEDETFLDEIECLENYSPKRLLKTEAALSRDKEKLYGNKSKSINSRRENVIYGY